MRIVCEGSIMGVSLFIRGSYQPDPMWGDPQRDFLNQVDLWIEEISNAPFWREFLIPTRITKNQKGQPAMFLSLYSCGEEIELAVPEAGEISVSAKTSTVGPGYHIAVCKLFQQMGDSLTLSWVPPGEEDGASHDDTGYFFEGDATRVEEEMLNHLKMVAAISCDMFANAGTTIKAWGMPLDHDYDCPGGVHTPMGVRSMEWIQEVAKDPRQGIDVFPWWEEGLTASFYLGRAVSEMWSTVAWRPILKDEEYDLWDMICDDLCRAYQEDPTLNFPWREWLELVEHLENFETATSVTDDLEETIRQQAKEVSPELPLIGYRRHLKTVKLLDGWKIQIPGGMLEAWDDNIWSAWDGERTVWFRNWRLSTKETQEKLPAEQVLAAFPLEQGEPYEYRNDHLIGKGILRPFEEDGKQIWNLKAFSAVDGESALCSVFFEDKADLKWAIAVWHTLTHKG